MKRDPISPYFDIKTDAEGQEYMEVYLEGIALLRLVLSNKGTAFTEDERVALGLDGLLPPQVNTLEQQVERVYRGFLREPDPIAKYQYLRALQERAETLFYALLERHLETCPTCPPLVASLVGVRDRVGRLRDPDSVVDPSLAERIRTQP